MDSELTVSCSDDPAQCCKCGCSKCSIYGFSGTWLRSVKRKYDEFEQKKFYFPGLVYDSVARVQADNEIAALREMVSNQQQTIQDLLSELEEERNASSTAANEAMSMILRLQREKAEVQMEARQFKRLAEEKMGHDQQEIFALEEVLYKREQAIQSLTCEVQAYKHRMMSYWLTEAEADGENSRSRTNEDGLDSPFDIPTYDYPPLKCNMDENYGTLEEGEDGVVDIEKYAFGETPKDHLKNLEFRIYQMERNPSNIQFNGESPSAKSIQEKNIVGQSPRRPKHLRRVSADSSSPMFGTGRDTGFDLPSDSPQYSKLRRMNDISEAGDDMSDRIYTVDSVHTGLPDYGAGFAIREDYITTPRDSWPNSNVEDPDIKKLHARLQALEADRESMRHTIMSIQTDKAQLLLLKEIAQQLCKDASSEGPSPRKKTPSARKFSMIGSIFKWMGSVIFWRKRSRQTKDSIFLSCRYTFGISPLNVGLLLILDRSPQTRPRKLLTRTISQARV